MDPSVASSSSRRDTLVRQPMRCPAVMLALRVALLLAKVLSYFAALTVLLTRSREFLSSARSHTS